MFGVKEGRSRLGVVGLLLVVSIVLAGCQDHNPEVRGLPTEPVEVGAQIDFELIIPNVAARAYSSSDATTTFIFWKDGVFMEQLEKNEFCGAFRNVLLPGGGSTVDYIVSACSISFDAPGTYTFQINLDVPGKGKNDQGFHSADSQERYRVVVVEAALKGTTTTTIESISPNPSIEGEEVTVEVVVRQDDVAGVAMEEKIFGEIKLTIEGAEYACGVEIGWRVNCKITGVPLGEHLITATYVPADGFVLEGSTSAEDTIEVEEAPIATTTTIDRVVSPNLSLQGQSATFYVSVTGSDGGTPTRTVAVTGAGGSCTVTLDANGEGNCSYQMNQAGQFTITAAYSGDSVYGVSNGTTSYGVLAPTPVPTSDSCNNDDDCDGFANDVDECPDVYSLNNDGCP